MLGYQSICRRSFVLSLAAKKGFRIRYNDVAETHHRRGISTTDYCNFPTFSRTISKRLFWKTTELRAMWNKRSSGCLNWQVICPQSCYMSNVDAGNPWENREKGNFSTGTSIFWQCLCSTLWRKFHLMRLKKKTKKTLKSQPWHHKQKKVL